MISIHKKQGGTSLKHALVVGGTGMLCNVSLWLAGQADHVSIIARNAEKMDACISRAANRSRITPVLTDYADSNALREHLNKLIGQHGPVDLAVAWIHSYADQALVTISNVFSQNSRQWELYHVLGSTRNPDELCNELAGLENCNYHQIQLGFILENHQSRWLTNEEISDGVIEAIQSGKKRHIVGQLEPWDKRP